MKKHIIITLTIITAFGLIVFWPEKKHLPYYAHEPEVLEVEITGAIKKPGTYKVNHGMTLAYLIDLSGGLLESADISHLILGTFLNQSTYHIPSHETHTSEIIKRINLNTANYNELILIPNITENRALEILMYRKEHVHFKTLEDLLHVKGIGVATFDKIKIYFYI